MYVVAPTSESSFDAPGSAGLFERRRGGGGIAVGRRQK
jgi:hypothetical protein